MAQYCQPFCFIIVLFSCFTLKHSSTIKTNSNDTNCAGFELLEAGFSLLGIKKGRVCCPDLGCFSNDHPEENKKDEEINNNSTIIIEDDWKIWKHLKRLPKCADEIEPQFYCYSNQDTDRFKLIDYANLEQLGPKLMWKNDGGEVFVIIHGWHTDWPSPWMYKMRDAFLSIDKRVILVRWSNGSNTKDYAEGAANTRVVGAAVARFIQRMILFHKFNLSSVVLVGFSLGAHAAGLAAKRLPGLTRLVGLDPAGPLFACQDPGARIDVSDAKSVQIFHTNGKSPLLGGRGTLQRLGHVDFYVNGGVEQMDCDRAGAVPRKLLDVVSLNISSLWSTMSCSHQRAPAIYTEIILRSRKSSKKNLPSQCSFLSIPCDRTGNWQRSKCFSCSANNNDSTSPCFEPSYVLDVNSKYKGKFYFDLRPDGAQNTSGTEFCGRFVSVGLKVKGKLKGSIKANFVSKSQRIDDVTLLKRGDRLKSELESRLVTLPWNMTIQDVQYVEFNYTQEKNLIDMITGENKEFVLEQLSITDLPGNRVQSCTEKTVSSSKMYRIELKSKC